MPPYHTMDAKLVDPRRLFSKLSLGCQDNAVEGVGTHSGQAGISKVLLLARAVQHACTGGCTCSALAAHGVADSDARRQGVGGRGRAGASAQILMQLLLLLLVPLLVPLH
jgi:hypothetical protein